MNRFEQVKGMEMPDAKKYLTELLGDKAEILFEELRVTVKAAEVEVGAVIKYGGIEWVVLECRRWSDSVLVVAKDCLFEAEFDGDNENNWADSPLRDFLNDFADDESCTVNQLRGIKRSDLVMFERDLTTDDGMTDYGKCKDYISLYTCDEYRRFRKLIPNCGKWHWTITGDSIVYSCLVRGVGSGGSLSNGLAYYGSGGVRPLCNLKSDTLVEVISWGK